MTNDKRREEESNMASRDIMSEEHPIKYLWEKLQEIDYYPNGVKRIDKMIHGIAFFPGGAGLWLTKPDDKLPPMPINKIMVLGHNFDSEKRYGLSLSHGGENMNGPTWRNLRNLFERAEINLQDCFFTNAYMGLVVGDHSTGKFPGANDERFMQACESFLMTQIETQKPRLILTLGNYVPSFLARLSSDLTVWRDCKTLTMIDRRMPFVGNAHFESSPDVEATVIALTHPSFRHANIKRRIYHDKIGDEAELVMLKEAKKMLS